LFATDCGNEWNGNETVETDEDQLIVKDSNGNLLSDGDDVLLIKDLKYFENVKKEYEQYCKEKEKRNKKEETR